MTLIERHVDMEGRIETFHSLGQADYVTVLAVTRDGRIPLVRQYRPAMDAETLELPGGLLEAGELPEHCAIRELTEEVGLQVTTPPRLLGNLQADTGRLENRLWCFLATDLEAIPGWQAEAGLTTEFVNRATLLAMIADGRFTHALHIGVVGLALAAQTL
ncbi:MAG: NUDIX hydrolase [Ferrovibrio sp.]